MLINLGAVGILATGPCLADWDIEVDHVGGILPADESDVQGSAEHLIATALPQLEDLPVHHERRFAESCRAGTTGSEPPECQRCQQRGP